LKLLYEMDPNNSYIVIVSIHIKIIHFKYEWEYINLFYILCFFQQFNSNDELEKISLTQSLHRKGINSSSKDLWVLSHQDILYIQYILTRYIQYILPFLTTVCMHRSKMTSHTYGFSPISLIHCKQSLQDSREAHLFVSLKIEHRQANTRPSLPNKYMGLHWENNSIYI